MRAAVLLVSAGVIGFEVSLLRILSVASFHHFAFLVVTAALLGFGASGTALCFLRERLVAPGGETPPRTPPAEGSCRVGAALFALALATGLSMPVCCALAQAVPVEARLLPALLARQVASWALFWAALAVPFFLGGALVGLALMTARERIGSVYAANLAGSAAGAMLAPVLAARLPPEWLPLAMGGVTLIGAVPLLGAVSLSSGSARRGGVVVASLGAVVVSLAAVGALLGLGPPEIRVDPYKDMAHVRRLVRQGSAERVAVAHGPRGTIEAYRSAAFHDLPFLGGEAAPPSMTAILLDGHRAASLLRVRSAGEAAAVDGTLMAFPYALAAERPRVLLLGEMGGAGVWLAARRDAASIDVVQPHARLLELLRGPLREEGGLFLDLPGVRAVVAEPRHFLERERGALRHDLIEITALESSAAGSGGAGGLAEDHLITVEGLEACLARLAPGGIVFACRGIQTPPRDNLKLLGTFAAALRRSGVEAPERHVVIVRDFLGVCTAVRASPWDAGAVERVRRACRERQLTPVWFPGIEPGELNRPDALPGPPGGPGDWYHHAARRLLGTPDESARFIDAWPFDIRAPVDDRPFFLDFCKLSSLRELRESFGDLWPARTELAFPFVLAALLAAGLAGALLTLLPLALLPAPLPRGRAASLGYFGALGLAYMLVEMAALSRLTALVGDAFLAAALTIAAFLLFSGLGSLIAERLSRDEARLRRAGPRAALGAAAAIGGAALFLDGVSARSAGLPDTARLLLGALAILPPAVAMGIPMPAGLARLDRGAAALLPWALGVNGFASVLAVPLASAIGMTWGFRWAGVAAIALYVIAALLFARLPGNAPPQKLQPIPADAKTPCSSLPS